MPTASSISPRDLLHLKESLEMAENASSALNVGEWHERDRRIGIELKALAEDPLAQCLAWFERSATQKPKSAPHGHLLITLCLIFGAVAGALTAFAALFYDGGQRVNVLLLIALFALLPMLGATALLLAAFSSRGFVAISSGQIGALISKVLPSTELSDYAKLIRGDAGSKVTTWLILSWSQWLGLGYGLGAVVIASSLVLFTDLAFGWSTTINLSSQALSQAIQVLATPWQGWLPSAVPSNALIEGSRYFRLDAASPSNIDPLALTRWWPFVLMTMLVYGVLPRLAALLFARQRLQSMCKAAFLGDQHVRRLLQRMNTPIVRSDSLQSETHSDESGLAHDATAQTTTFAHLPRVKHWIAIRWAQISLSEDAMSSLLGDKPRGNQLLAIYDAGGTNSITQDEALSGQLSLDKDTGLIIITKAWEPPTLELIDFVELLRTNIADSIIVAVMPLAIQGEKVVAPSATQQQVWQSAFDTAAIENLRMITLWEAPK